MRRKLQLQAEAQGREAYQSFTR